jgi:hypothetical protein
MSDFVLDLLKKYNQGPTEIALSNMQKIDKGFNTDNVFALAYLATNEAIPEADREVFKELVHLKIEANRSQKILPQGTNSIMPSGTAPTPPPSLEIILEDNMEIKGEVIGEA